jgi:hypothetical protein
MASTLMDQFMKMTATRFLQVAVQGVINKIMDSKLACEVCASCNIIARNHLISKIIELDITFWSIFRIISLLSYDLMLHPGGGQPI